MTDTERKEIIDYGLYRLKIILAGIAVTLLLGYILGIFVQSLCFLSGFFGNQALRGRISCRNTKTLFFDFLFSIIYLFSYFSEL